MSDYEESPLAEAEQAAEVAAAAAPGPRSILDVLGTLPSGQRGARLSFTELTAYLQKYANCDADIERNKRHALRDELYRDGGEAEMTTVINKIFKDDHVKELRKEWIKHTRFNNVVKRIVNELSTVYAEPAKRSVAKEMDDAIYQSVLDLVCIDERAIQWSRLANLHRVVLVGFRVRLMPDQSRAPVIDIVTPTNARAVMHPNDGTLPIGFLIKANYRSARPAAGDVPMWTLWTDYESVQLREDCSVLEDTYRVHKLGVCPWVPLSLGVSDGAFWPGCEGEDLVAAQISTWLVNVLLLKETKSATKQTIVTGDGASTARGQSSDSEVMGELSDGQAVQTVDMSMDLSLFRDTADHILDCTANNYGLSPALVRHQGVQSAEARDLMRIPLREIRKQQQTPLARFESRFVIVMAKILAVDLPELAFDPAGWRAEFGEAQTPLTQQDAMDLFLEERQAGLANTIDFWLEQHPGASEAEARGAIKRNIELETERVGQMKELLAISGQAGGAAAQPKTPGTVLFDASGNPMKGGGFTPPGGSAPPSAAR